MVDPLQDSIAIVGIACKFPGARNKNEFWENLIANKESVTFFTNEELAEYELDFDNLRKNPNYIGAKAILDDIDQWDAPFFNVLPSEAKNMDPQQRLWLENTWHAFEDAGINPFKYKGNIGVYAGSFYNSYLLNNVLRDPLKYEQYFRNRTQEIFQTYIHSDPMFLATKTAYHFNLKGPAINIQTACSTSLVAVAQACSSLLSYESDVCVSGGVTIMVPQQTGYIYQEGAIGSSDGHCRPFDKDSKGTIFGNGVGTVILKRLKDAIADNDRIYSIIRGWAVNNDGYQKIGFTAPSIEGQYKAIASALKFSGLSADQIKYVEAHGTATPLGDPIEVTALSRAFRDTTNQKKFCALGSVKSNIGHLDVAAGVAGLIKLALSAYHRTVPATLHYKEPNPKINFDNTPFYVLNKNLHFAENESIVMGISSLGVGGTNAHLVVSDYQTSPTKIELQRPKLLLLSARSVNSLRSMNANLVNHLNKSATSLESAEYTLLHRRNHFPFRSFAVANNSEELNKDAFVTATDDALPGELAFMFPGQGAQFVNMGRTLMKAEPVFKENIELCFKHYEQLTGDDFRNILFADEGSDSAKLISQTQYTQPALFMIEYSMARLYIHYGLRPNYLVGHSIGEYTAACLSGVFDLKSAMAVVVKRGQLMQTMPAGCMMAVTTSVDELKSINSDLFEIAADNSQSMCTISLALENEEEVKKIFELRKIRCIRLQTSHAFHSKAFDPILQAFEEFVAQFSLNKPEIPFISCLTGSWIADADAMSPRYWARQLREMVRFKEGISTIAANSNVVFLETGPNTHLSGLVLQNNSVEVKSSIVHSLGKADIAKEHDHFVKSLGELWIRGVDIDFITFTGNQMPDIANLPLYAFDHKRYWVDFKLSGKTTPPVSTQVNEITESSSKPIAAQSSLDIVKNLLCEMSGYGDSDLANDKKFIDLGFDSLFLARYAAALEKKTGQIIEFRKLVYDYPSIEAISGYLDSLKTNSSQANQTVNDTIRMVSFQKKPYLLNFTPFQTEGAAIPLVMVHGDDLDTHLPKVLGNKRPYLGYLHLSADGRKIPFRTAKEMAAHYLQQLIQYRPNGPYILAGFSFGGILAFEMALQLQKMGQQVPLLFIMDCGTAEARVSYDNKNAKKNASEMPRVFQTIVYFFLKYYYKIYYKSIRMIRDAYFLIFKKLPVDFRRKYVYDIYTNLSLKYRIDSKFNGKLFVFKASENISDMKYLGWDKYADHIEELIEVEGNHETILRKSDTMQYIIEKYQKHLEKF